MMRYALVALTVLASGVATHLSAQSAGHATTAAKPTIVLVHGAWADASGWYDVTLALQARGYKVVAGANMLLSYAKDAAAKESRPHSQQGALPRGGTSARRRVAGSALGEPLTVAPAWKTVPSWYVVATQDRAINPELERFMAKRMNARVTELPAGHLVFISRARDIARIIESASQ